jgi:autotransporter-associated beta strand protein
MITPSIIEVLFWIMAAGSILWGVILIVSGATSNFAGGTTVLVGVLVLIMGPIASRVYCEILIVVFKIHSAVESINLNMNREHPE